MANSRSGTGWRQRSTGFLASVAAIVLIVVLLGGMAIGYEIEKSRVKSPATTGVKKASKKATPIREVGTVTATTPNSISITLAKGAKRKIAFTKGTIVVKAAPGAGSDIAANVKVIFSGAGSLTKAKAVIVLPNSARLGTMVTAADGNTMSLKSGAKVVKITTTGATVEKVSQATIADVVKGAKVMVQAVRTKAGPVVALEIIVLPSGSGFE